MVAAIDAAWEKDWPAAVRAAEAAASAFPSDADLRRKLYAARISLGDYLASQGRNAEAAEAYLAATDGRGNAVTDGKLRALTPTAVPPTLAPVPTAVAAAASATPQPDAARTWIPGLTAADVTINLQNRGMTCEGPTRRTKWLVWTCKRITGQVEQVVDVWGLTPARIWMVNASVLNLAGGPADPVANQLFPFLATLPYDGANPTQAQRWVRENL